jgi:predicted nucleic acid-binding protein
MFEDPSASVYAFCKMKAIYLDVCCLNRPFDDQTQERIRLESEAVETILLHIENRDWEWIGSEVTAFEVRRTEDWEKRWYLEELLALMHVMVPVQAAEESRAGELKNMGFKDADALHLACAETRESTVFLTTDDGLLKVAARHASKLRVVVRNPLRWLHEVHRDECSNDDA